MKKILVFVFITFILSCSNKYAINTTSNQKSWKKIKSSDGSLPIARHEASFSKVEEKFYLIGGRGVRNVSIFDTNTKKWTQGAKPPIEFHHFQPIVYGKNIYIIGALTGKYPSETPVSHVYMYNTEKDIWTKGDQIPANRLRGSTGNILKSDIVYLSCGISNGHINGHKNWLDSYNIKTGEWKILPNAPRARDHFQAVEHNNKIYLLAGRLSKAPKATFNETIGAIDVFDIKKNEWSTLQNEIPTQRAGNMAVLFKDDILVIGGESIRQNKAHNEVEALNTKTHKWKKYPSLIEGRHGTGILIFNDEIYIASGCGNRGGAPELNTMEKY